MKNLYDSNFAKNLDDLELRVYTSRLLGSCDKLVLHGGGNTSVKIGNILYVKGSGWDLATIQKEGFAPVNLQKLIDMLNYDSLSDSQMVKLQREAMSDKSAPNPSVEAILHAIIPYKYVDHTHADAIVTLTNSKAGLDTIKRLYKNYLIVPYVMPGFILAKEVYKLSKSIKWEDIKGIILLKHGIFTFANSAKESYDNMIQAVTKAELEINKPPFDLDKLQDYMSQKRGFKVSMNINTSYSAKAFSTLKEPHRFGILTPEHIIRTKRYPVLLEKDFKNEIDEYISEYISYFNRHKSNEIMLNPAPNWAVVRDYGIITFGKDNKECNIIEDIAMHTIEAIFNAQKYGGFDSLNESECFKMEYWELEQAKLKAK